MAQPETPMKPIPPEESLIEYPSAFPIKVMGAHVDGFFEAIVDVALRFDPGLPGQILHGKAGAARFG